MSISSENPRVLADRRAILVSDQSLADKGQALLRDLSLYHQPLSDLFIVLGQLMDQQDDEAVHALIDVFSDMTKKSQSSISIHASVWTSFLHHTLVRKNASIVSSIIDSAMRAQVVWSDQNSCANVVARHFHQGLEWMDDDLQKRLVHLSENNQDDGYSVLVALIDQNKQFNPHTFLAKFGCTPDAAHQVLVRHMRNNLSHKNDALIDCVEAVVAHCPSSAAKMVEEITQGVIKQLFSLKVGTNLDGNMMFFMRRLVDRPLSEQWASIQPCCVVSERLSNNETLVSWDYRNNQALIELPSVWPRILDATLVHLPSHDPLFSWNSVPHFLTHAPLCAARHSKEDLMQQLDIHQDGIQAKKKM